MKKRLTILAFGPVTDAIGGKTLQVEGIGTSEELIKHLEQTFPALKNMKYALAVNKQLVSNSVTLEDGATIALLPPFSGG